MKGLHKLFVEQLTSLGDRIFDEVKLAEIMGKTSDDAARIIGRTLLKTAPEMLANARSAHDGFVSRNRKRWSSGFDLLETLITISHESGESFAKQHGRSATKRQDHKMLVLTRLHARSCLISREILTLMVNGFADGAQARWRSLHELAVTASFLASKSREVSEMYLAHQYTESGRASEEYQKHCQDLGYKPISLREMSRIKKTKDAFVTRFGPEFERPYGWAAIALGVKKASFGDIEEKAGLEHMRPWYRMASHSVHAGPHGLHTTLGLSEATQPLALAGSSNSGMADPGHATAIAVVQVTAALLQLRLKMDEIVSLKIMNNFSVAVGKALLRSHKLKRLPED